MYMDYRRISLVIAESIDAWRIIPRIVLVLYSTLVFNLYLWFKSIPTYVQEQCDAQTLSVLLDKGLQLTDAKTIACSVVDIVGGPTAAQSAFVTTIISLSAGIFGLYAATGRRWEQGFPEDAYNKKPDPYGPNPNPNPNPYGPNPNPYGPNPNPYGPNPNPNLNPYGPNPRGPWGSTQPKNDGDGVDAK